MAAPHIMSILGTTREERAGAGVARWFAEIADARDDLTHELADLRDVDLPFIRKAKPPGSGEYDEAATGWAEAVGRADGFVFVTAEYNHGYPAVLKNALDHVYAEWNRKPVAFVSYGSTGGGLRAVEQLRLVAVELQMAPLRHQVAIPRVWAAFDEHGQPKEPWPGKDADRLLDQLVWWARALAAARAGSD